MGSAEADSVMLDLRNRLVGEVVARTENVDPDSQLDPDTRLLHHLAHGVEALRIGLDNKGVRAALDPDHFSRAIERLLGGGQRTEG